MIENVICSVVSHVGNSRGNNEDNFLLPSVNEQTLCFNGNAEKIYKKNAILPKCFCCCVSDGMGGHSFGEVASLKTVEFMAKNYNRLIQAYDCKDEISNYITDLNDSFCRFAQQNINYKNMGATLCGVVVNGDNGLVFNVGDSRFYVLASGKLKQITVDHSEGQRLFDLQLLTTEELKVFPNRKAIYRYIGQKTNLIPDLYEITNISSYTYLLLCTDGLTDALSDDEIENILKNQNIDINEKCGALLNEALKRNINIGDNITLMLIGVEE